VTAEGFQVAGHVRHIDLVLLTWNFKRRLIDKCFNSCVVLLMLLHTPVTRMVFQYFDCERIGPAGPWSKAFLRADYAIQCQEGGVNIPAYNLFMPSVIFILIFYTMLLPISLGAYLGYNRKDLYDADVYVKLGWMYERFTRGSEWWEVHEMIRKMLLTGLIVFYPQNPSIRCGICLLICMIAIVDLNYFSPRRSSVVFAVEQWSFGCAALMFIAGVIFQADLLVGERKQLGEVIIAVACIIVIAGFGCAFWLLFGQACAQPHRSVRQHARLHGRGIGGCHLQLCRNPCPLRPRRL
jgi:hypothetical protein